MTPAAIIDRAHEEGVVLTLTPQGTIKIKGSEDTVSRWVPILREHKPDLLAFMKRASDPAIEQRRGKVLSMLNEDPKRGYAIAVNDPDTDPVIIAVGIRNLSVFQLEIPAAFYDPVELLELIEKHALHAHRES